jgi:hypothetical protein
VAAKGTGESVGDRDETTGEALEIANETLACPGTCWTWVIGCIYREFVEQVG